MNAPTQAVGISVDDTGRIIVCYLDKNGQRQQIDLTEEIERIAKEVVTRETGAC